jgi:hypothetical protein
MGLKASELVNAIEKFNILGIEDVAIYKGFAYGFGVNVSGRFPVEKKLANIKFRIPELAQSIRFMSDSEISITLVGEYLKFHAEGESRKTAFGIKVVKFDDKDVKNVPDYPEVEILTRTFPEDFLKGLKICSGVTSDDPTLQYLSNIYAFGSFLYSSNDYSVCRYELVKRVPKVAFPAQAIDVLLKSKVENCTWGVLSDKKLALHDSSATWLFTCPEYQEDLISKLQEFFTMEGKVSFSIPKTKGMETMFQIQQSLYTKQGIDKEVAFFIEEGKLQAVCFDGNQWVIDQFDIKVKTKKNLCFIVSPDLIQHAFKTNEDLIDVILFDNDTKILLTVGKFQQLIALREGDIEKYARILHGTA